VTGRDRLLDALVQLSSRCLACIEDCATLSERAHKLSDAQCLELLAKLERLGVVKGGPTITSSGGSA
jgi:hypothetical protein